MKKWSTCLLIIILLLTGCNGFGMNDDTLNEREKIENELNPGDNQNNKLDPNLDKRLGYVNYKKDQVENDAEQNRAITIDRNALADMISRLLLRNDTFQEVATLVTDQEVLIAYERNEETSEEDAAKIAKKTATSLIPGYMEVYVSDNPRLIADLQSLHHSLTTNKNDKNVIKQIIEEMEKSPQSR